MSDTLFWFFVKSKGYTLVNTPLFKAQIPDWRAMVDVVLIDTAYDGKVFNITLSDVPERKNDLVSGRYELPAPEGETTIAVKIIDMLVHHGVNPSAVLRHQI